jgi:hypothetical protein
MSARWSRDPGVDEMIQHLDQPNLYRNVNALNKKEYAAVVEEGRRCANDFEYAARNYFWITTKESKDTLFRLWPSQEILLDELHALKAMGRAQKLLILKSRQLGCSTLVEALLAWRSVFFPNINGLVVSVDEPHSQKLFSIILHIYDMLPWWLQPMVAAREYKDGIWFANPDPDQRRFNPGINSKVYVQHSTQKSGIGQGETIHIAHISEHCDWFEPVARQTIEGDLKFALPNNPETIAVLESTGHGAGSYGEELWLANVELGEMANWRPVFLPWFLEKSYVLAPPSGWHPDERMDSLNERVQTEWVRCCEGRCGHYQLATFGGVSQIGRKCSYCEDGILQPVKLSREQIFYYHMYYVNAKRGGEASMKTFLEEMPSTPQEAWQITGIPVFPEAAQQYVNGTIRAPKLVGYIDHRGMIHGVIDQHTHKCLQEWCDIDHTYDTCPLRVWELPDPVAQYTIGVDVAEGLGGKHDYSVAFINKVGASQNSDVHVATWRSNTVDAVEMATTAVQLGYLYNTAMLSIEYNMPTCADVVRIRLQYPNLFRWKNYDSERTFSNKWHWKTQVNTKPKLWQTARRWLGAKQWVVRSDNFLEEMKRFQKDREDSRSAGAERSFHDDELLAAMICLFTSHDMDYDEELDYAPVANKNEIPQDADYEVVCTRCGSKWGAKNPERALCSQCGCRIVRATPRFSQGLKVQMDWNEITESPGGTIDGMPEPEREEEFGLAKLL